MARFTGKTVIVTGAAGGIGAATAQRFAAEGATVVIADIDNERGLAVATAIRASNGLAQYCQCDVASLTDWQALTDHILQQFGRLDVVRHNAIVAVYARPHELAEEARSR